MTRALWMLLCLTLLTTAVYWPIHRCEFVDYDDGDYVYANPHVRAGFTPADLKYAFTTFKVGNWNPLLWISFYIDHAMFGIQPRPMHIENVLLHLITGLLLWRLLFVTTGRMNYSFVVAAIFLVHPMHVESVAWISERKDVLSTPLLIGAMLAYVRFCKSLSTYSKASAVACVVADRGNDNVRDDASDLDTPSAIHRHRANYALMLVLFAGSLMVKSMGVTLPAILLLMDFWPLRRWTGRSWLRLILEKLPLLAMSLALITLATHTQAIMGAAASTDLLSIRARIDNALVCYVIYIAKLIVPINLAVFYQHPGSRPLAPVIAAGGLLLLITLLALRLRRSRPYLITGWFWFLGTLVPVIGLVQIGGQSMADRYSYLPSIGLFIAAVWGAGAIVKNPTARLITTLIVLGIYSGLTLKQVTYWQDTQTLFTHAANVTENNLVAHNALGHMALDKHQVDRAIDEYTLSLKAGENARAYDGLGNCWLTSDRPRAIRYFRKALNMDSHPPIYHVNLATALRLDDNLEDARREAQTALSLDPGYPPAIKELGEIQASNK